jgi:hypothetical protein
LTIKSISNTKCSMSFLRSVPHSYQQSPALERAALPHRLELALLVVNNARQIFNCQRSDFFVTRSPSRAILLTAEDVKNQLPVLTGNSPSTSSCCLIGLYCSGPLPSD